MKEKKEHPVKSGQMLEKDLEEAPPTTLQPTWGKTGKYNEGLRRRIFNKESGFSIVQKEPKTQLGL